MEDSESSLPDIKALSLSVAFHGWRQAQTAFKSWATKMSLLHRPTWRKAGIFEAVMASTKRFNKDSDLVMGVAERWCPETNTFLFPWGEATITLEDVMVLLGFSVLGSPYFTPLDSSGEEVKATLEEEWVNIREGSTAHLVTKLQWMRRFMGARGEVEHVAFLALWLSYFVLPTRYCHVDKALLSIAVHLSRGTRIALAPPVLAHLYAELTLLKEHIRGFNTTRFTDKLELSSLFKLVQVWTWERFRELRPNNTNPLRQGEPRLALWDEPMLKKRKRAKSNVREILSNSEMDSFEWRPYTKAVKNWKFPKFYPEEAMCVPVGPDLDEEFISFARCVKVSELVGVHSVERYFPNRVASQFGLLQDVPCPVKQNNLFKEAAWDEFNKPIDGLRLYIPSRSAVSYFTSMFCKWWRKHKRAVEVAESLAPRGDDYDTSEPVPSGSKKSMKPVCKEEETQIDRYKTQVPPRNIRRGDDDASEPVPSGSKKMKSMKRVCKDDGTLVPSEKDEAGGLTIGQAMRSRKKNKAMCSSVENHSSDPPPKVLPLKEKVQKQRKEFLEKLKRSRDLRTATNVRSEIADSGGSASRELPLNELSQKEEVVKRKSEHLGDKRGRNITTAEMVIDREESLRDVSESLGKRNSRRLERDNNDSWIRQKLATKDETVAQGEETGNKAGKNKVLSSANGNNASDPPLGADGGVLDIAVSRPKTRQNCDDEVGVNGIMAEKKKTAIVAGGSKESKCVIHEDGENQRSNEEEDVEESLKQTNLAIEEISLNLEARMMKVEKTLAKIREWKTIERNQDKNGITA